MIQDTEPKCSARGHKPQYDDGESASLHIDIFSGCFSCSCPFLKISVTHHDRYSFMGYSRGGASWDISSILRNLSVVSICRHANETEI